MPKQMFVMKPKNLRDRLRSHMDKGGPNFIAPHAKGNPHPGLWVVDGQPYSLDEIAKWAVDHNIINGDDRNALLGHKKSPTETKESPVTTRKKDFTELSLQFLTQYLQGLPTDLREVKTKQLLQIICS